MDSENSADHVFVDIDAEGQSDLLGHALAVPVTKLSIYKYVRTDKGWRYCKAALHPNGKVKPKVVVVSGVEEKPTEERYPKLQ